MRRVCEVSKDMHALMLPYLYRRICLNLYGRDKDLKSMFTARNPGLSHIRTLRFMDGPFVPFFDNSRHLLGICHLLTVTPRNVLRTFESVRIRDYSCEPELTLFSRLRTTNVVHQELELLLRIRQQRLLNYQHHSLPLTARILTPAFDEVSHVTCLQLFLRNGRDCDIAKQLLDHMPLVTSLSIKLSRACLDRTMGGKGETGRAVVNKIFGSANPSDRRLKLKRLRIEWMSFKSAGIILPTLLPLEKLEHLHLFKCRYTSRLFESLTELKLRLVSVCDQRAYSNGPSLNILDVFLKSMQPQLRKLRLSRDCRSNGGFKTCDWPSLVPHAHELRCLELDDWKPGTQNALFSETRRSLSGFSEFCDGASQLQQLSMNSPGLEEVYWDKRDGLQDFLVRSQPEPQHKVV